MDLLRARVWLIRRARAIRSAVTGDDTPEPAPAPVNGYEILEKVAALRITEWSYTFEPDVRHLGPMAQDFMAAFGLGDNDRRINMVDSAGVCLVSIQALHRKLAALEAEVTDLRSRLD